MALFTDPQNVRNHARNVRSHQNIEIKRSQQAKLQSNKVEEAKFLGLYVCMCVCVDLYANVSVYTDIFVCVCVCVSTVVGSFVVHLRMFNLFRVLLRKDENSEFKMNW